MLHAKQFLNVRYHFSIKANALMNSTNKMQNELHFFAVMAFGFKPAGQILFENSDSNQFLTSTLFFAQ